jgi:hypothetical protein
MAWCPSCGYEFADATLLCPDCNVSLDEMPANLSSGAVSPDDSWVEVARLSSNLTYDLAKSSLDQNNIPSMIISSNFGAVTIAMRKPKQKAAEDRIVLVPKEYRDEASILLQTTLGDSFSQPGL